MENLYKLKVYLLNKIEKMWHKEVLLIIGNYIFRHNVFNSRRFWKHCGISRKCSSWATFPIVTMFSTISNEYALICRYFPCSHLNSLKTVCSRFMFCFNPFPHIDAFWRLCTRRLFENIVTKEEIAQNEQFLLLPLCFTLVVIGYPFNYRNFLCFDKIYSK